VSVKEWKHRCKEGVGDKGRRRTVYLEPPAQALQNEGDQPAGAVLKDVGPGRDRGRRTSGKEWLDAKIV
jgi:hypothetical protein